MVMLDKRKIKVPNWISAIPCYHWWSHWNERKNKNNPKDIGGYSILIHNLVTSLVKLHKIHWEERKPLFCQAVSIGTCKLRDSADITDKNSHL